MFRTVSVKKLFFLLLAAILALLLLFFIHGPFLDEGVEDAVARALLDEAGVPEEGTVPAEGHKIFQAAADGDVLQVWGISAQASTGGRKTVRKLSPSRKLCRRG